jgi:hypothetical protein
MFYVGGGIHYRKLVLVFREYSSDFCSDPNLLFVRHFMNFADLLPP